MPGGSEVTFFNDLVHTMQKEAEKEHKQLEHESKRLQLQAEKFDSALSTRLPPPAAAAAEPRFDHLEVRVIFFLLPLLLLLLHFFLYYFTCVWIFTVSGS